jgi:hypothetical protein
MSTTKSEATPVSPDVLAYVQGPPTESLQFDFLIGEWRVQGRRFGPAGEQAYAAAWRAQYLQGSG